MECRKQLCEKCKKKEDDYFLVTLIVATPKEKKHFSQLLSCTNQKNCIFAALNKF